MIDLQQLRNGADVLTADGNKLGEVDEIGDHVLIVKQGLIFRNQYVVPRNAVTAIDETGIHLGVSQDQVTVLGWEADSASTQTSDEQIDTFADHVPESPEEMFRISTDTGTGEKPTLTGREYGKE